MAINFPVPATVGEEFVDPTGITFVWNGTGWTHKAATSGGGGTPVDAYTKAESDANFVNVPGDTMTGPLSLPGPPTLAEHATRQDYVWAQDETRVNKAGDTMTGSLTSTDFIANAPAGGYTNVSYKINNSQRWQARGADSVASNFELHSFDDAGAYKSMPLTINRASGDATFSGNVGAARYGVNTGGGMVSLSGDASYTYLTNPLGASALLLGGTDACNYYSNSRHLFRLTDGVTSILDLSAGLGNLTGALNVTGTLQVNSGHVISQGGNANYWFRDTAGITHACIFWSGVDDSLVLTRGTDPNLPTGYCRIIPNGQFFSTYGYTSKPGILGLPEPTTFNFGFPATGGMHGWVDAVDLGVITFTSDYRVKKDVVPLPTMWDTVKALNPISYTQAEWTPPQPPPDDQGNPRPAPTPLFIADDIERWGFIAHELQETLVPSAANGVKDAPNEIQSPNPFTIIAALTKALQEAMTRIEALEAQLTPARAR